MKWGNSNWDIKGQGCDGRWEILKGRKERERKGRLEWGRGRLSRKGEKLELK